LSRIKLSQALIPVPSLPEQRKIAEILGAADEVIHSTQQLTAKLEQTKHGLLHDVLTQGIDVSGHLRKSPCTKGKGPLPPGWQLYPLEEIADVSRGQFTHRPRNDPAYYGGEYPFIQTGDIARSAGGYINSATQSLNVRGARVSLEFPVGTIAVTIAANIADTAILSVPMYFPDSVVGIQVRPPNNVRYVELCIRAAKPGLEARAPQSAQKNINLQDLRPLMIPVPEPREQERIASEYETYENYARTLRENLTKLRLMRRGLLEDLLTGQARVGASG